MYTTPPFKISPVDDAFALALRRARLDKRLSQRQVAVQLGMSRMTLAHIEHGRQRISLSAAIQLSIFFDFNLMSFIHLAQPKGAQLEFNFEGVS